MTAETRSALEQAIGALREVRSVSGGCISPSYRVELIDGRRLFVKTAAADWSADAFAEEARSLRRLRAASALPVPAVIAVAESWLALEWLEPRRAQEHDWVQLGTGLAAMHRVTSDRYGWESSNYIGSLPQANAWCDGWAEFWREQRLRPLLERAAPQLERGTVRGIERLFDELDDRLQVQADGASLLHGDLWHGNVHISEAGAGVIDPASYYGHREVDLAMAALFGGFPSSFFAAYTAARPLLPGARARQPIYQLYYLLVHVVLFGASYAASTAAAVHAALQ